MQKEELSGYFGWHAKRRNWMSNYENRVSTAGFILNDILKFSFKGNTSEYDTNDFEALLNLIHCFLNTYVNVCVDELYHNCCSSKANKAKALPQNEKQNHAVDDHDLPQRSQQSNNGNKTKSQESKKKRAERNLRWFYLRKKFARERKQKQNEYLKVNFGKLTCINYNNVIMFVSMVLRKLLPPDLFGTHGNERRFLMFVRKYLKAAKPIALLEPHRISRGMHIKTITWLKCLPEKYSHKKQAILAGVLLWIMENIVETLLRHYFHRSKMNKHNNEIFYYCKYKYIDSIKTMLQVMQQGGIIKPLEEAEVKSLANLPHYLGSSPLFCIPTDTSIRPVLMGCEDGIHRKDTQQLLSQLQATNKYRIDPRNDIKMHQLWLNLWKWWKNAGQPKLYFCKADITNAFGSVQLDRLCQILDDLRDKFLDANMVLSVYKCTPKRKPIKWLPIKMSYDALPDETIKKYAQVKLIRKKNVDAYMLIEWVKKIVRLQVFHFKNQHYLMQRGLGQGRWLSSKLCDLYLSHMDARYLHQFCNDENLMLRAADDYVFVSANKDQVKRFLQNLEEGLSAYGCLLSSHKCVTNINSETNNIHFCGNILDINSLSVSGDYSKYKDWKMVHQMKLKKGKPGKVLYVKMKNFVYLKLSRFHLEGSYNQRKLVCSQIFQAALLHALRMHAVVCLYFESKCLHIPFISKVIKTTVIRLTSYIQRSLGACEKSNVSYTEVMWLIYSAVQFVIHRYSGTYPKLHVVIRNQKAKVERTLSQIDPDLIFTVSNVPSVFKTVK